MQATGDQADIARAESLWSELGGSGAYPSEVSWDDKWAMTFLLMFDVTRKVESEIMTLNTDPYTSSVVFHYQMLSAQPVMPQQHQPRLITSDNRRRPMMFE